MRESTFAFPALGRACICVSSGIYDRRALDAPAASLPLINSLTHLTYLTATSPRVRDIISHDGGLERLVRILQQCARGLPSLALPTSLADVKGKGKARAPQPRVPRKSPFKAFAEYDLLPTYEDLRELQDSDVDGALLRRSAAEAGTSAAEGYSYMIPPSLFLPTPSTAKHVHYTYSLAFQCIVNIGVRGSEAIRTRVVEAGALDVVTFVLERYLQDVERQRVRNVLEWRKAEEERLAQMKDDEDERVPALRAPTHLHHLAPSSTATSPASSAPVSPNPTASAAPPPSSLPHISVPPSAISRPLLTRLNVVAASSAASSASFLAVHPPSRVHTPDTIVSMDEASSLTGDENGSASGQEQEQDAEGDEVMVASSSSSSTSSSLTPAASLALGAAAAAAVAGDEGRKPMHDASGDVVMGEESARPAPPPQQPASRESSDAEVPPAQRRPHRPHASRPTRSAAVPAPALVAPQAAAAAARGDAALHFRDEDILLSLQLLAYLSKYPHVRSIFHAPSATLASSRSARSGHPSRRAVPPPTNVFSLVEAFTFRPPQDDPFTPRHPAEVQYWAGVIMRNACRKDEAQGGIRQCANMRCGKWEVYAREFAKCRRCRRAKYCSKTCQSEAWNQGHRYWCHKVSSRREQSASRGEGADAAHPHAHSHSHAHAHGHGHGHGHGHSHRRGDRAAALAGAASDNNASGSSAPASPTPNVATPTNETPLAGTASLHAAAVAAGHEGSYFPLVPPVPTPARRRSAAHSSRRRRRTEDEEDDDDEDDDLELRAAVAAGMDSTTPRAAQGALLHPHAHGHGRGGGGGVHTPPAPAPPAGGPIGLDGMGMFDLAGFVAAGGVVPGAGDGVPPGGVAIDEDQVAREMLAGGGNDDAFDDAVVRVEV
ncbi:MYND-type zinc finger protein MUB1 [Rhodotorula paludigena]|uniref:MYND-type zinc finger protein MUB1 n=1 Tax=Rhodotorula paludigena TaxID=86838 RepID=UPI00317DF27C